MQGATATENDKYRPLVAFGLSIMGALIFFTTAKQTFALLIKDYSNIIPEHLICGLLGMFLQTL
jgi:ammonia channel protein AmtB